MPAKPKNKSKIIAVSSDNTTLNFDDAESVEPDFNKVMGDVKLDDVKVDDVKEDISISVPIKEKKPRPKAKPKAKPVAEPVAEPIIETVIEHIAEVPKDKKQVECPDCKKKLPVKTLKYNHVHNCPAKRFTSATIGPSEPAIEQPSEPDILYKSEPKQITDSEFRNMKRQNMIKTLMADAF